MFGPNNTPSADLRLDLPPEPEPSAGSVGGTIGSTIVVFKYIGCTYLWSQNQAQVALVAQLVAQLVARLVAQLVAQLYFLTMLVALTSRARTKCR